MQWCYEWCTAGNERTHSVSVRVSALSGLTEVVRVVHTERVSFMSSERELFFEGEFSLVEIISPS